jgi:single-strand DNA-binding protein
MLGGIMNNLNSVLVEGNLVREPLFRTTARGTPLCTFQIANNRFFKSTNPNLQHANGQVAAGQTTPVMTASGFEKEVSFFDIESWMKVAETCRDLGRKGRGVRVVGRLKEGRWNDTEGKHHSRVAIVAEHVEFKPESYAKMGVNVDEDVAKHALKVGGSNEESAEAFARSAAADEMDVTAF